MRVNPQPAFGKVLRPIAQIRIWSPLFKKWLDYTFIVDTGADYTLLPKAHALNFGVNLRVDCKKVRSQGIGGVELVYFFEKGLKFQIEQWKKLVPLGFLNRDDIPPILGRAGCLDNLNICFRDFATIISSE